MLSSKHNRYVYCIHTKPRKWFLELKHIAVKIRNIDDFSIASQSTCSCPVSMPADGFGTIVVTERMHTPSSFRFFIVGQMVLLLSWIRPRKYDNGSSV